MPVLPSRWLLAVLAAVALLAGCTADAAGPADPTGDADPADAADPTDQPGSGDAAGDPDPATALDGELLVFAAASLADAFEELAAELEAEHPDLDVVLNLGGSQTLAAQLLEGAPGDVFASANRAQLDPVVDAGLAASEPAVFAQNALAIVVEAGNPTGVSGLADLARDDLVVVLAGEEVPAGRYTAELLAAADVEVAPASLEVDVRAVLGKVALGEADAGVVYRSDLATGPTSVQGIEIPAEQNVLADYPIVTLTGGGNPQAAEAFVALVRSDRGQQVLTAAGFRPVA